METETAVRQLLARALDWTDAHAAYDTAVLDLPPRLQGIRPEGLPHSAWELIEHIRITQRDILDFCTAENYREPNWPEEYWPSTPEPPSEQAWEQSVGDFREDRAALRSLAMDPAIDVGSVVPNGTDQTYIREILLVIDHTACHVGQLVLVRRALGAWPGT
ncbi:MAG: DinB family protein [Gemmatimonadota bacterium]